MPFDLDCRSSNKSCFNNSDRYHNNEISTKEQRIVKEEIKTDQF